MVMLISALVVLTLGVPQGNAPQIELIVSEEIAGDLAPLEARRYAADELTALFARMRELSEPFCRMRYQRIPFDAEVASRFITPSRLEQYRDGCLACEWDLKAGCWNFIQMNDLRPEIDFELLHRLVPAPSYDCYAVGLMQPYIMHNILGCQTLTMLDFDWRIHDAHFQLLEQYRSGAMANPDLDAALKQITVGWLARSKGRGGRHAFPAEMRWLCRNDQRARCVDHLRRFDETRSTIERVALNLAPLHRVALAKVGPDVPRVLYLSNALDPVYTSRRDLRTLLTRIGDELADGQQAILIHHSGGEAGFGLYRMQRGQDGPVVTTLCRDRTNASAANEDTPTSESASDPESDDSTPRFAGTPLNLVTRSRGAATCHDLLARRDAPTWSPTGAAPLACHWPLDETTDNLVEAAPDGTAAGEPGYETGVTGAAMTFDGRDDAINLGPTTLFDGWRAVTLAAWVRPRRGGRGKWPTLIEKAGGRHQHVLWAGIRRETGHWAIQIATDRQARFRSFGLKVPYGKWSHVAITLDLASKTTRLYVDGALARERHLDVAGDVLFSHPSGTTAIGQITRKKEHVWRGGLDDVRIYRGVLDMQQIAKLAATRDQAGDEDGKQ